MQAYLISGQLLSTEGNQLANAIAPFGRNIYSMAVCPCRHTRSTLYTWGTWVTLQFYERCAGSMLDWGWRGSAAGGVRVHIKGAWGAVRPTFGLTVAAYDRS